MDPSHQGLRWGCRGTQVTSEDQPGRSAHAPLLEERTPPAAQLASQSAAPMPCPGCCAPETYTPAPSAQPWSTLHLSGNTGSSTAATAPPIEQPEQPNCSGPFAATARPASAASYSPPEGQYTPRGTTWKYWTLGTLGPAIPSPDWLQRRHRWIKSKSFGAQASAHNLHRLSLQAKEAPTVAVLPRAASPPRIPGAARHEAELKRQREASRERELLNRANSADIAASALIP
jgi:hypothetical protein